MHNRLSLIKNELFFGSKKISNHDLVELIKKNYSTKKHFIISYDDDSTYEYYLELISIYNNRVTPLNLINFL